MSGVPETRYARYGDAHIAYQVLGNGPDLLFVPLASMPIDLIWDEPAIAGPLRRLASFSRLILTDLIGVRQLRQAAIRRPSSAAGLDRWSARGARRRRERTCVDLLDARSMPTGLAARCQPSGASAVSGSVESVREVSARPDHPSGYPEERLPKMVDRFTEHVGTGALMEYLAPSWAGDDVKRRWWARCERLAGGPGYLPAMYENWMRATSARHFRAFKRPACSCGEAAILTFVKITCSNLASKSHRRR